jgi:hypothetical protein
MFGFEVIGNGGLSDDRLYPFSLIFAVRDRQIDKFTRGFDSLATVTS